MPGQRLFPRKSLKIFPVKKSMPRPESGLVVPPKYGRFSLNAFPWKKSPSRPVSVEVVPPNMAGSSLVWFSLVQVWFSLV